MGKRKPKFEDALQQLETIAAQIEQGEIGLEESISQYEKGMALVKQCRDILAKAEHRIQELHEHDGAIHTSEFKQEDTA